jgi:tape measure domain-containing protein
MATIEGVIRLKDHFSPVMQNVLDSVNRAISSMGNADKETQKWNSSLQNASNTLNVFSQGLGLIERAASFVGNIFETSMGFADSLSTQYSRLNMMNDGLQTTAELQEQIYQAANRSKMSYTDMANSVASLGTLARDAFGSTAEIVSFNELLGKTFTISATDDAAKSSAMLQLTQALSSGVLQGDEFKSISESAPMLMQYMADYLGVTRGELKKMASEGQITADVIKGAMFGAADDINAKFAEMPLTFGQVKTMLANVATQAFQPAAEVLSSWLATEQGTQAVNTLTGAINGAGNVLKVFATLATNAMTWISAHVEQITMAILILGAIAAVVGLGMAISWAIANWPLLLIIAAVALFINMLSNAGVTAQQIGQIIGNIFGWLYAVIYNIIADLYNVFIVFAEFFANVFNDPIGAIQRLFWDLADSVLGVLQTIADAIDAIFGSNLASGLQTFRNNLSSMVASTIGENKIKFDRMEKISTSGAMETGAAMADSFLSELNFGETGNLFGNFAGNSGGLMIEGAQGGSPVGVSGKVEVAEEDIKYILDMTERRYINMINLSSPAPVVNVKFGDVHEKVNVDELTNDIADSIIRSLDFVSAMPEEVY